MPEPTCPICGKPVTPRWRPFCSERCTAIDLGRWFGEAYRMPDAPAEPPPPDKPEE